MARFHVYRLKNLNHFAVDIQSDLLDMLTSRVIVPLIPIDEMPLKIARLNPQYLINGLTYVLAAQLLTAVSANAIGEEVGDLTMHQDEIVAATDFLFQGF